MCLPFLKEKAESFSDNIIRNSPNAVFVLNEKLEFQQANTAALKLFNQDHIEDIINRPVSQLIDPRPYVDVMDGSNVYDKLRYFSEFDRYGEETIIYDKNFHIVMSIIRDCTKEQREYEAKQQIARQTAEITDHVIQKQMKIVQEIASLLGETTAETRVALMNLKESLSDD
jgi:PAS domain-containing protein